MIVCEVFDQTAYARVLVLQRWDGFASWVPRLSVQPSAILRMGLRDRANSRLSEGEYSALPTAPTENLVQGGRVLI